MRLAVPTKLCRNNYLAIAVETIVIRGELVPTSYAQQTVEDLQITTSAFLPVATALLFDNPPVSVTEFEASLPSATSLRRLTRDEFFEGDKPACFYEVIRDVVQVAAKHETLLVIHSARPALHALLDVVEKRLGIELPPVQVVSTAVLRGAYDRADGQRPTESDLEYYRRIEASDADMPELMSCWNRLAIANRLPMGPGDALFPVMATTMVYSDWMHTRSKQSRSRRRSGVDRR